MAMANALLPAVLVALMAVKPCNAGWMHPEDFAFMEVMYGIPGGVLYSIAMTESQKDGRPWAWTMNYLGRSYYFADRETLHKAMELLLSRGRTNFDFGPMQIHWRYHRHLFESTWDATDPYLNMAAGAKILLDRYREHGNWLRAIAAYHSKTERLARRYLIRFARNYLSEERIMR